MSSNGNNRTKDSTKSSSCTKIAGMGNTREMMHGRVIMKTHNSGVNRKGCRANRITRFGAIGIILLMLALVFSVGVASAKTSTLWFDGNSGTDIDGLNTTNVVSGSTYTSGQYYTLLTSTDTEGITRTRWRDYGNVNMYPILTLFNDTYAQDTLVTGVSGSVQILPEDGAPDYYVSLIDFSSDGEVILGTAGPLTASGTSDTALNFDLSAIYGTISAGHRLAIRIIVDGGGLNWRVYGNNGASGQTTNFVVNETLVDTTPTYNVTVTPSPSSAGVVAGDSYIYTITVNNNGNTDGNYTLGVSDSNSADFQTSVLGTSALAAIAGGSAQTTLTVTAKVGVSNGVSDITTVTATSVEDATNYTGSGQVTTTVQAPAPSVNVTLTPSAQVVQASNQVQYTVTVTNTGNIADSYTLSLDNADTADFTYGLSSTATGSLVPGGQYIHHRCC